MPEGVRHRACPPLLSLDDFGSKVERDGGGHPFMSRAAEGLMALLQGWMLCKAGGSKPSIVLAQFV